MLPRLIITDLMLHNGGSLATQCFDFYFEETGH